MKVIETDVAGVLIVEPTVFSDNRGFLMETFQAERYAEAGVPGPFVQDNLSFSQYGILRGLHFQYPQAQGKLVYVLHGKVFDVAVDIRSNSPHFGRWFGIELSAENNRQLWVPPGFAHGFCVTSQTALCAYKCTDYYNPACEMGIRWDDPKLRITWPIAQPSLSDKDAKGVLLAEIPVDRLPKYGKS